MARIPSRSLAAWGLTILLAMPCAATAADTFLVLSYHDVRYDVDGDLDDDQTATGVRQLVDHFEWLDENGWTAIGIDDLLASRGGERPLPDKAVLLTFDDGYASTYRIVFPLLKLYSFPAVVAVVSGWLDAPAGEPVRYGDALRPRDDFLTWDQVREMTASGLVEIASHSHALHAGVQGNPQGNRQPAATTRRYDPERGRYESDAEYRSRVGADLRRSVRRIGAETGRGPRVMVWPYGEFNGELIDLAAALGMPVTMTTAGGPASSDRLDRIPRYLLTGNPALADVVWQLRNPDRRDPPRAVQVDLDYVYDPDPRQQARNLDLLLDRVRSMAVNYVYLQAFADPDGDDVAASVYFRNRHLPVRADLFNRVAWQLRTRAGVRVLAWMPVLAFDVPGLAADRRVMREVGGRRTVSDRLRLSPFDPEARKVVLELYEDLARHAHFQGLLFHDDARLDDFEDAGPAALERFAAHGLPPSIERIRADPSLRERATRIRTTTLTRLTDDIAARVRRHRGEIETARSMFAQPLLDPAAEEWFGQSLTDFLDRYDHTVVMAYPYMEQATRPMAWLEEVAAALPPQPDVRDRVLLQLQTRDWRSGEPIAESTLEAQIRRLQSLGVRAFAWYPDDFHRDQPPLDLIRRTLSLRANPWQP